MMDIRPPKHVPGPLKPRDMPVRGTPPRKGSQRYVISGADNLYSIAAQYGRYDPGSCTELYQANAAIIERVASDYGYGNSNRGQILIAGTVINIPGTW